MIKYESNSFGRIKKVEVDRETESSVWLSVDGKEVLRERRAAKRSEFRSYFDTWDDAKNHLIEMHEGKVAHARAVLKTANDRLGNIKGMKNPEEQK